MPYVLPYMRYLSAVSFTDTFRLNPGILTSFSHQYVSTIFYFSNEKITNYLKSQIEKNNNMYKCLSYYDEEFKSIVSTMLKYKFNFYKTIFQSTLKNP